MTRSLIIRRLVLPGAMALFMLLALAYWWLDNLPHEIFGTALFGLLAWHIGINRYWFRNLFRGHYDARRVVTVPLHLALNLNMGVLLVTSIAISRSVPGFLPGSDSRILCEIHWFAAYWIMIMVGIHIGLHWTRVMASGESGLGMSQPGSARTWLLRAAAALLVMFGFASWSVLDVRNKLTFTSSLEFWDFTTSVSPFFGHWAGVIAVPAVAAHYMMVFMRQSVSPMLAGAPKRQALFCPHFPAGTVSCDFALGGDLHGRCKGESIGGAGWRPLGLWSFWRLRQRSGDGRMVAEPVMALQARPRSFPRTGRVSWWQPSPSTSGNPPSIGSTRPVPAAIRLRAAVISGAR